MQGLVAQRLYRDDDVMQASIFAPSLRPRSRHRKLGHTTQNFSMTLPGTEHLPHDLQEPMVVPPSRRRPSAVPLMLQKI